MALLSPQVPALGRCPEIGGQVSDTFWELPEVTRVWSLSFTGLLLQWRRDHTTLQLPAPKTETGPYPEDPPCEQRQVLLSGGHPCEQRQALSQST